jgi:hypothetical protein
MVLLVGAVYITLHPFYRLIELEGEFESAVANNEPAFIGT